MTSQEEILQLFERWNHSLQSGDSHAVAANYAQDAVLVPTFSNKVRHSHEEIVDYFKFLLQRKSVGRIIESNVRIYGDIAINSGVYVFTLVTSGATQEVPARYTFVYRKIGDDWKIIEHHSSFMPE